MELRYQGILTLMRCAVTGETLPLPEGFSLESAEELTMKQNIEQLVYAGALACGISASEPVMQRLFRRYVPLTVYSERQMAALETLLRAFDESGIDYLPVKGSTMKRLYPRPELRYMGDADILIRVEQYDKIRPVMEALGYEKQQETDHEIPWKSKNLSVELHKSLIPTYNKDYFAYFGSGWRLAKPDRGSGYRLSAEDDYIFQFTHFAKHYRNGGVGSRYVVDLWLLGRRNPGMDWDYIRQELDKLQLLEFFGNIRRLIDAWFEGGEMDEKLEFMTEYIFSGGSWGTWRRQSLVLETHTAKVTESRDKRNAKLLLRKLFPPLTEMTWQYPVLKKLPVLLPVLWVIRLVTVLLFKREKIRKTQAVLRNADDGKMAEYYQELRYVGLDFNFE